MAASDSSVAEPAGGVINQRVAGACVRARVWVFSATGPVVLMRLPPLTLLAPEDNQSSASALEQTLLTRPSNDKLGVSKKGLSPLR